MYTSLISLKYYKLWHRGHTFLLTEHWLPGWLSLPILHGLCDPHCGPPYLFSLPLLYLTLQISVL